MLLATESRKVVLGKPSLTTLSGRAPGLGFSPPAPATPPCVSHWSAIDGKGGASLATLATLKLLTMLNLLMALLMRFERRMDMRLSTLREVVEAMGGELRVTAYFPDAEYRLEAFERAKD